MVLFKRVVSLFDNLNFRGLCILVRKDEFLEVVFIFFYFRRECVGVVLLLELEEKFVVDEFGSKFSYRVRGFFL